MKQNIWNKSLLVASAIAAAILVISVGVIWNESSALASRLTLVALVLVVTAAACSYLLRVLRMHLLLVKSGVPISLRSSMLVQSVGLALSITPAAAGEVLKLRLIQERAGTPVLQTAPVLILERVLDSVGFILLGITTAAALPAVQNRLPDSRLLILGSALVMGLVFLGRRVNGLARLESWLKQFAWGKRLIPSLGSLRTGMQAGFNLHRFSLGLALTGLARVADGLVLFLAAAVLGVPIALPAALLILVLSGAVGSVSLLPGGAGAVESAMAGLLVLAGAPLASALAIALLARLSSLWLWVALGLVVVFLLQFAPTRTGAPVRVKIQ